MDDSNTKSKQSSQIILAPQTYFFDLITSLVKNKNPKPRADTEFYIVKLLEQFISSDRLFMRDQQGHYQQEPLALMLKQAIETENEYEQRLLYRNIGDVSLYVAGFFQESLNSKLVDIDYYIGMGQAAYERACRLEDKKALRLAMEEIANRFSWFVELLGEASEQTMGKSEKDLMMLYEMWLRTGNDKAARLLGDAGIYLKKDHDPKKSGMQ